MPRLYRRMPDSRSLERPRSFVRVFAEPGTLRDTVEFYTGLTGVEPDMDMAWPEARLHLVAVGAYLILEMDPREYPVPAATPATVLVADLDEAVDAAVAAGAAIEQPRFTAPVGAGARLRHPDGLLVEYVEHRPSPYDVDVPPLQNHAR